MAKRRRRNGGRPRKTYVSTAKLPWNGDHGTGTAAANKNTEIVEVADERGSNPNRMARRQRVNRVEWMMKQGFLDIRQYQAAKALQDAYGRVESLSSGSPLKERVQASPKPDATIAVQCDAVSVLTHVMRPVLRSEREIVEHVCWHNGKITDLGRMGHGRAAAKFRQAMDRVADHLCY